MSEVSRELVPMCLPIASRDMTNLSLASRVDDTGVSTQIGKAFSGYFNSNGEQPSIETADDAKAWALTQQGTGLLDAIQLPPQDVLGKRIDVSLERRQAFGLVALVDLYVETKTGDFASLLSIYRNNTPSTSGTAKQAWAIRGCINGSEITDRLRQIRLGFTSSIIKHYFDERTKDSRFVNAMSGVVAEFVMSLPPIDQHEPALRPWEVYMRQPIDQW